jgi:feruloyl esterase
MDSLSYLEAWVEENHAPQRMISARVRATDLKLESEDPIEAAKVRHRIKFPLDPATIEFTRPVYPYPTTAKYSGHGNPKDAANFTPVPH